MESTYCSNLRITQRWQDGALVVVCTGLMTRATVGALQDHVAESVRRRPVTAVVCDFRGCSITYGVREALQASAQAANESKFVALPVAFIVTGATEELGASYTKAVREAGWQRRAFPTYEAAFTWLALVRRLAPPAAAQSGHAPSAADPHQHR